MYSMDFNLLQKERWAHKLALILGTENMTADVSPGNWRGEAPWSSGVDLTPEGTGVGWRISVFKVKGLALATACLECVVCGTGR